MWTVTVDPEQRFRLPDGCADAVVVDGRHSSNVYEVNPWLWQFGCRKPRLGGLTVVETAKKIVAKDDARKSVLQRLVSVSGRIEPDWKLSVFGTCSYLFCTSIYFVYTLYILSTNHIYKLLVHTLFFEIGLTDIIHRLEWRVLAA
jgi:hypothetical protein